MKNLEKFRKIAALVLALAMVMTAVGTLADPEAYTENIYIFDGMVNPEDAPVTGSAEEGYVMEADLKPKPSEHEGIYSAMRVESASGEDPSIIELDGTILQDEEREAYAEYTALAVLSGNEEGYAEAHVTGDVIGIGVSTDDYAAVKAVEAKSGEYLLVDEGSYHQADPVNNQTVVTVDGKAIAQADGAAPDEGEWGPDDGEEEIALLGRAYGEGNSTTVTIGEGAEGKVELEAWEGGVITVEIVSGGITTDDEEALTVSNGMLVDKNGGEYGDYDEAYEGGEEDGVYAEDGDAEASGEEGDGEAYEGPEDDSVPGGTIEFEINGDVISEEGDRTVTVHNYQGDVTGTINGAVEAPAGQAINIDNTEGTVGMTVNGLVSSTFEEYNVEPQGFNEPAVNIDNHDGDVHLAMTGGAEVTNGPLLNARNDGGSTFIEMEGGATVANGGETPAVALDNENGEMVMTFGDGDYESTDTQTAFAAAARGEDAESTILFDGSISNENTADDEDVEAYSVSVAMDLQVEDGGSMNVLVTGDYVAAHMAGDSENSESTAVQLTNRGGEMDAAFVTDLMADGANRNTALSVSSQGSVEYTVRAGEAGAADDGEFVSWGYGSVAGEMMEFFFHNAGDDQNEYVRGEDGKYYPVDGKVVVSAGTSAVRVIGDVASGNVGVELNVAKTQTADVIVDGSIVAPDPIVIYGDDTEVGGNVKVTVWEIVAEDEDDPLIMRETYDDSGVCSLEQDRDAEKQIQYIIRVMDGQEDIISTEGTTVYNSYNVAREGQRVTLKLTLPEGCEIAGAFGGMGQQMMLLMDDNGNYYLDVPRGGGVVLNVVLKEKPQPTPQEPEAPTKSGKDENPNASLNYIVPNTGAPRELLKAYDESEGLYIIFYSNGVYRAVYQKNGTSKVETGQYRIKDGFITLQNTQNDEDDRDLAIKFNEDKKVYELIYISSIGEGIREEYTIQFTQDQFDILWNNLKNE